MPFPRLQNGYMWRDIEARIYIVLAFFARYTGQVLPVGLMKRGD